MSVIFPALEIFQLDAADAFFCPAIDLIDGESQMNPIFGFLARAILHDLRCAQVSRRCTTVGPC